MLDISDKRMIEEIQKNLNPNSRNMTELFVKNLNIEQRIDILHSFGIRDESEEEK